jgi:hypothetical protein
LIERRFWFRCRIKFTTRARFFATCVNQKSPRPVWSRFGKRPKEDTLWYYRELANAFQGDRPTCGRADGNRDRARKRIDQTGLFSSFLRNRSFLRLGCRFGLAFGFWRYPQTLGGADRPWVAWDQKLSARAGESNFETNANNLSVVKVLRVTLQKFAAISAQCVRAPSGLAAQ